MDTQIIIRCFSGKKNSKYFELPRDRLNYHDVTICISGSMQYEVNDTPCTLGEGDMIYFSPGDVRRRFQGNTPTSYVSFNFFSDIRQFPHFYYPQIYSLRLKTAIDLFSHAYNIHQQTQCIDLLDYILLEINLINELKKEDPRIREIKEFIHNRLRSKITIEDIAKHVYLSKIYCESFFKQKTGTTLIQYINDEKIRLAQDLMLQNELSLTQISDELAFTDYNYFSRCFKKLIGMSPTQYINLNK